MADKAQLTVLRQGARAWNEWRAAHAGLRPDLVNAGLCGLDLAKVNLAAADLRKADLRGTDLRGAALTGADLEGADFFRAVLDGADLDGANLVGARFLHCPQLATARNWQSAFRDLDLACGVPIPQPSRRH
jgi:uncharacterized protein YjbI with pentapeptide repeats